MPQTQHVTFDNVGSCWPTMLRPFTPSLTTNSEHELLHSYCLLNNTALKLQTRTKQSVIGPTHAILEEKEV